MPVSQIIKNMKESYSQSDNTPSKSIIKTLQVAMASLFIYLGLVNGIY